MSEQTGATEGTEAAEGQGLVERAVWCILFMHGCAAGLRSSCSCVVSSLVAPAKDSASVAAAAAAAAALSFEPDAAGDALGGRWGRLMKAYLLMATQGSSVTCISIRIPLPPG